MLADVASQLYDLASLRQYAPLAEEASSRYGHTLYQAIAQRAWGVERRLAGEFDQAETRLKRALELFEELDTHWQIGRTLKELGELSTARADTFTARDYFTRALAEFEKLKALPDADRTRAALKSIIPR